jgi:hypothetical protein
MEQRKNWCGVKEKVLGFEGKERTRGGGDRITSAARVAKGFYLNT